MPRWKLRANRCNLRVSEDHARKRYFSKIEDYLAFFFSFRLSSRRKKKNYGIDKRDNWRLVSLGYAIQVYFESRGNYKRVSPLGKIENFNSKRWKRIRTI